MHDRTFILLRCCDFLFCKISTHALTLPVTTTLSARQTTHLMSVAYAMKTVHLTRSQCVLPMRLRSKTSACFSWASANAKLTTPFIIQAVVQVRQFNFAVTVTITLIDNGINDGNDKDCGKGNGPDQCR